MNHSLFLAAWLTRNLNGKTGYYFHRAELSSPLKNKMARSLFAHGTNSCKIQKLSICVGLYELALTLFLERVSFSNLI